MLKFINNIYYFLKFIVLNFINILLIIIISNDTNKEINDYFLFISSWNLFLTFQNLISLLAIFIVIFWGCFFLFKLFKFKYYFINYL